ncbi:MAG TPA: adenylate/guanylate cyclase domain-containing protein, partial [Acidimicrobiia bacterium]
MGFLDTVKQAGAAIQREGRVSKRAMQREFDLDDAQLDEVVAELVEVRGVATADGDVLVAAHAAGTTSTDTDRRDLTVLFCDLVGSTELSTRLDSEDYGAAIRVYHDAVTAVVARFGGFVAQLLGDGLLVLFGYPEASEDSAEQAVRAALEIVRAVEALPSDLSVRVGLHSGPCVIRTVGAGGRHDTVVLGETPNIAARVQAIAEAGAVVMTAATQRLVEGFVVEGAGSHSVKGVPQPIAVHRVLSVSTVGSPLEAHRERGSGPFVGRDRERQLLFDAWDRAARGSGHAVHICGEPGIGKSRLAIELREHLRGRPHATLGASCTRYVRNTAFHPVQQIVERVVGFTAGDEPGQRVALVQDALRAADFDTDEMLALLCSFLAVPHAGSDVLGDLSPEARRRRTIDGLVELLVAFSAREPIAVLIEDLHWCDPSSLEVVARVVDRVATERILLVTTSRPEFTPAWAASANVAVVNLEPVTKRAATELVDAVLDGWDAREAVRRTIVERAEGNPLFLEELSQMVLESDDATAIPFTLQSSLLARLDRLGSAKFFAQVAAVIGREFSRDMLRLVVAEVPHAVAIGELDDALEQLTANGLILRRSPDTYVFKHALVQDAAIHSLLRTTRGELHRGVVRVLRDEFPTRIAAQP